MKRKRKLEKLLEEIKSEPLADILSGTEIKFLTELEYLKRTNFELSTKYYRRYAKVRGDKMVHGF